MESENNIHKKSRTGENHYTRLCVALDKRDETNEADLLLLYFHLGLCVNL
jgi:hypothetical protein